MVLGPYFTVQIKVTRSELPQPCNAKALNLPPNVPNLSSNEERHFPRSLQLTCGLNFLLPFQTLCY